MNLLLLQMERVEEVEDFGGLVGAPPEAAEGKPVLPSDAGEPLGRARACCGRRRPCVGPCADGQRRPGGGGGADSRRPYGRGRALAGG
jgi:hypothetical protein